MDKRDVEMEDAEKKLHDVDESLVESLDSSLKPGEVAVTGQQSTESLMECQDSAKTETHDQPVPAEYGNGGLKSNVVEGETNVNDQTTDGTNSKGAVEDQMNAASEAANQSDAIGQPATQFNTVGDDQTNATGGTEGETKIEKKEGDLDADVALKKEEPIGNVDHHDAGDVNMQVHEEPPANEVGEGGEEAKHVRQAENSITDVHQNGNDLTVDEQKTVEHKSNTASVIADHDAGSKELSETKDDGKNTSIAKMPEPDTPKAGQLTGEASNKIFDESKVTCAATRCGRA